MRFRGRGEYAPLLMVPFFLGLVLTGCGGGGGGDSDGGGTITRSAEPQVTILWPARSRSITGSTAALSAKIAITGDGTNSETFTVNRPSSLESTSGTYTGPVALPAGNYSVDVRFYAQTDGGGDTVASAAAVVYIGSDGQVPDIAMSSNVASVEILPGQTVPVGSSLSLAIAAKRADGAILAVTPGSFHLNVDSGSAASPLLRYDGGTQLTGLLPGIANVTATVDGVTSSPAAVTATSDTVVTVSPASATLLPGGAVTLSATVANAPDTAVTWSIQEQNGGTISPAGVYTAPLTDGMYHIVATSVYDPMHTATATVTVQAGGVSTGGDFPESGGLTSTIQ